MDRCINRIRLEFKEVKSTEMPCKTRSINRIRLEFKVHQYLFGLLAFGVLIESDWNLKWIQMKIHDLSFSVLIESDWNLKHNPQYTADRRL